MTTRIETILAAVALAVRPRKRKRGTRRRTRPLAHPYKQETNR